ncbi:MAG: TetR/AcrR family transcriptional regulator C-terminal domain-containing protein [Propioniciclava sp.]
MATEDQPRDTPDVGLSARRVVAEAIRMADREGVDRLSMRRLASALDAGAMSLYHYVANKEALLDAMIEVVLAEIELPSGEMDWQAAMRQRAVSARGAFARHRWAIGLVESRTSPGPANLRYHEALASCLRRAGFGVLAATHAGWVLDSYLYGFVLQEASLPFATADELADTYLPQLPADEFPYLQESAAALVAARFDPAEEFLVGLDLILGALEPLRVPESS